MNKRKLEETDIETPDKDEIIERFWEAERRVGIIKYICPDNEGFHAVIKARFSDFVVSEVSTDMEIAAPIEDEKKSGKDDKTAQEIDWDSISDLISPDVKNSILAIDAENPDNTAVISDAVDKEQRTRIHKFIKTSFTYLASETLKDTNSILIKYMSKATGRDKHRDRMEHIRFVLQKTNRDTFDALNMISRQMNVSHKLFGIAGTKDKRGITTQFVTASKVSIPKLKGIRNRLGDMVSISGFKEVQKPLKLGDLFGNRFTIALRNVAGPVESIERAVESLKETGFINYFGMQRFGGGHFGTHQIGQLIMQQKYREACEFIMNPMGLNDDDISENLPNISNQTFECNAARAEWQKSRDASKCFDMFPSRMVAERAILSSLIDEPGNYGNAIMRIPRNLRMIYVHAFQSFVWNHMVTKRLELGMAPLIGDLYKIKTGDIRCIETQEECDRLNGDITNIILPIPGHAVMYPKNIIGEKYVELLKQLEVDTSCKHPMKEFHLSGDYRRILAKCHDLAFYAVKYDNPNMDLIPKPTESNGENLGIVLSFTLESSSYATMALREISKQPTGTEYHKIIQ